MCQFVRRGSFGLDVRECERGRRGSLAVSWLRRHEERKRREEERGEERGEETGRRQGGRQRERH